MQRGMLAVHPHIGKLCDESQGKSDSSDAMMIYTEPHLDDLAQRMERVVVADASVET